ncbi:hypothetical protein F5Y04DRAFT_291936 [Hypomontagnella monticulosa]|nr:hypothetical protein F5Y04DRAFT_291936 [Hypomontagnella monticulosa]
MGRKRAGPFTAEEEKENRAARKRLRTLWKTGASEENKAKAVNLALKRTGGKRYSWMEQDKQYPTAYSGPEIGDDGDKSSLPIEYDRHGNVVDDPQAKGVTKTQPVKGSKEDPIDIDDSGSDRAAGKQLNPISVDESPESVSVSVEQTEKPSSQPKSVKEPALLGLEDDGGWEEEEKELLQYLACVIDFMSN